MTAKTYPITGIQTPVPLRQEVNVWVKENPEQVELFKLAFTEFQKMSYEDKLSYFRVAGIHGLPKEPWDEPKRSKNGYYCEHGTTLFPTWHRPYMLLFEQRIHEIMIDLINSGKQPSSDGNPDTDREYLLGLANSWRLPYWDWGVKNPKVPEIFKSEPLNTFKTPRPMSDYGITLSPYSNAKATSRRPDNTHDQAFINGVQNNDKVDAAFHDHPEVTDKVYRLLSQDYCSDYNSFATMSRGSATDATGTSKTKDVKTDWESLESVHGMAHGLIGGSGHMGQVPVAAFDPIFWFHHCYIDRLFAIWQSLNPDEWFATDDNDSKKPLTPFHEDKRGTLFDSDKVEDWTKYRYTYPELQKWLPKYVVDGKFSEEEYIKDIRRQVDQLYKVTESEELPVPWHGEGRQARFNHDYVVNVEYERFALGGHPFTVLILINGKVVGQIYNFTAPPSETGCTNCEDQERARIISVGQVAITTPLLLALHSDISSLHAFEPDAVGSWLKAEGHLTWKVVKLDGQVVQPHEIPSLRVWVVNAERSQVHESQPFVFRNHQVLFEATGVIRGHIIA
ncbi:Di-copper centre-containing protein [Sistotremastrum niveocremeum HHB9708]|uniref:tyrosinase n=1 Tax=Sistotremastrum niveocremeum HHB9708 TaxID=1314777 RepID=A0A164MPH2_9AGAM|nr:Di-copper centre-containing protein [Sistotremastrum niveocremeum HHB9708]